MSTLQDTLTTIVAPPKGVLVADEHAEALDPGLVDLALGTPALADHVSAVLLTRSAFDRRQPSGLRVGVRLAPGCAAAEVAAVVAAGAVFVEWRAHRAPYDVVKGDVHVEAAALARGAALAQAHGVLPVVTVAMPDLGGHSIGVTEAVTSNALAALRRELAAAGVDPGAIVVRVNLVRPGRTHPAAARPDQVARTTLRVLTRDMPSGLGGVLLLSGGQPLAEACGDLAAVAASAASAASAAPWPLTFAFSRPLFEAAASGGAAGLAAACRLASEALAGQVLSGAGQP